MRWMTSARMEKNQRSVCYGPHPRRPMLPKSSAGYAARTGSPTEAHATDGKHAQACIWRTGPERLTATPRRLLTSSLVPPRPYLVPAELVADGQDHASPDGRGTFGEAIASLILTMLGQKAELLKSLEGNGLK